MSSTKAELIKWNLLNIYFIHHAGHEEIMFKRDGGQGIVYGDNLMEKNDGLIMSEPINTKVSEI